MNPTYEEQVRNINSVKSTSQEDKARAISYLKNPMPLESLQDTNETVLPTQKTDTTTFPELTPLQAEEKRIQDTSTQSDEEYRKTLEDIGVVEGREREYAEELGATENRLLYKDYENKLMLEKRAMNREIARLQEEPQAVSQAFLNSMIADVERKSLQKQADLAILGNMALGKYNEALSIAKEKVESELKPLTRQLEYIKEVRETNKDLLTTSQKAKLNQLYSDVERTKNKEEDRLTKGNEMIINAVAFQAPTSIIEKAKSVLNNGGDISEISGILGKYSGDYYKAELLKEQIKTEKAQRASIVAKTEADKTATKPATQAQYTAAGFASRVVQAKDIIDKNQAELIKLSASEQAIQRNLPNFLKSPLMQVQEQAERNFVNSVLRRESGAAISPEEFRSAEKQYFPRPGDSAEVLLQKKQNRDLTANNLINEGGSAYIPQETNLFSQALGKTEEKIQGTSIVDSISNGIINFNIPKK